jgi:hypothetical protein
MPLWSWTDKSGNKYQNKAISSVKVKRSCETIIGDRQVINNYGTENYAEIVEMVSGDKLDAGAHIGDVITVNGSRSHSETSVERRPQVCPIAAR